MKGFKQISVKGMILFLLVLASIVAIRNGMIGSTKWSWVLLAMVPMIVIALNYRSRRRQSGNQINKQTNSQLN